MRFSALLAAFGLFVLTGARSVPLAIVVNSTNDPGDGTPDATETTLREAITLANANPGSTISFNIPGAGPHTITPNDSNGALSVTGLGTTIDATTQPGYAGTPLIVLDGSSSSSTFYVLGIATDTCTVRGFAFVDFGFITALVVSGGANHVEACYVGTDATGTSATGGTLSTGIWVSVGNNTIGGSVPGTGNVISGCGRRGVYLASNDNAVRGNLIGTNAAGTAAIPNGIGIEVEGADNIIGGLFPEQMNVISGNVDQGILIRASEFVSLTGTSILNNFIGLNASGAAALGNGQAGIEINSGSHEIGGASPLMRNVISGNAGPGILIAPDPTVFPPVGAELNTILGNYIGTDVTGLVAIGNGPEGGIHLSDGASANSIGGIGPDEGNIIAFNNGPGVWASTAGEGNAILSNSIHSNLGLGIDLGALGVQPNDPGDYDSGSNRLQNFPVLLSAVNEAGFTTVDGTFFGAPSTLHRVELFWSLAADPSGFGEGGSFLGFVDVTTDATGHASFSITLAAGFAPGTVISATATDADENTSEFSQTVTVTFEVTPPVVTIDTPTTDDQVSVAVATIDLGGTATDNVDVTAVTWTNSTGGSGAANVSGSDWTIAALPLVAGFNTITVQAEDAQGNTATDTITVYYDVSTSTTRVVKKTKEKLCGLLGIEVLLLLALRRRRA